MSKRKVQVKMPSSIRSKVFATVSMLLVATIMLVSTSYAWLVMSTAPEVSGISTQVGANGSLEIALLTTETFDDLDKLDLLDYDESQGTFLSSAASMVNTWGNLVPLSDPNYGLSHITLLPSRLNIMSSGSDEYMIGNTLLKTPAYGEDGRIVQLYDNRAVSSVYADGIFPDSGGGYGVRAIGTASNQSANQLALVSARNALVTGMANARSTASTALNSTGGTLGAIVVQYALAKKETGYTREDIQAMRELAVGLGNAYAYIEDALRAVYLAYISSDGFTPPADWDYFAASEEIQSHELSTLTSLDAQYPDTGVPMMSQYVALYNTNSAKVAGAIQKCDAMLDSEATSFTWTQISDTMNPLVDYSKMTVGGKTITELRELIDAEGVAGAALAVLGSGNGIVITVPSGSGIISDVADFADDYVAVVEMKDVSVPGYGTIPSTQVTMKTETNKRPVYLVDCNNCVKAMNASTTGAASAGLTDLYGYAIDLAFRTNAHGAGGANSHLLLQTEPENRIYSGSSDNGAIQGGGSFMQYSTVSGISVTKMVRLMNAIRVVFMDKDQTVLAIGALDAKLGQDAYVELSDAEKAETKKFARLDVNMTGVAVQVSDYVDQYTYNDLPAQSTVSFNPTAGTVKAKLYLYDFEMTKSTRKGENDETLYTGGLTLNGKKSSAEITELVEDTPKIVTAMVYMDGSFVNNSMVAADSAYSMTGVLNLQFASDVELIPAEIADLRYGAAEETGESAP